MKPSPAPSLLSDAWTELRRRKVVRAAGAYAVGAFVVLQVAEITFEPLGLPPKALTWTILATILGFPLILVLAWYFDVGPKGLTRDRSRASRASAIVAVMLVLLTTAGMGLWLFGLYERDGAPAEAQSTSRAPVNSVAVLPFDDMSPQRDQSYLADGIAEELLDRLARNSALKVAARTSSFALRGKGHDVRQIGELLGVRWLLEGSVRKAGDRLRITAQLIDTGSGFHQWSDTYERDDGDLFALQDAVSSEIAQTLQSLIGAQVAQQMPDTRTQSSDPRALEAFLAGRQQWRSRSAAGLSAALGLFQEAVERDPEFARAWSGLADTYLLQASYQLRPTAEALELAEPAAVRAVSLAPELGEAWASLGLLRSLAGQWEAAERSLREAMRLDPRYEMAPMWLADVLGGSARFDAQLEVLQQAQTLNPLEPIIASNLARTLSQHGRFDEADAVLQRLLALTPDNPLLLRSAADIAGERGQLAEALRLAQAALAAEPGAPASFQTVLRALLALGATEQASALAASQPLPPMQSLIVGQWIALYSAPPRWLPEARERVTTSEAQGTEESRMLRLLSAWAATATGDDAMALTLLEALATQRGSHAQNRFEAASLLAALRGETDAERARWCEQADIWRALGTGAPNGQLSTAQSLALCGKTEAALDALESAVRAGFSDAWQVGFDPRFASLRDAPRFSAALQRMSERVAKERQLAGL